MTHRPTRARVVADALGLVAAVAALSIGWRFDQDIQSAHARSSHGSTLIATRCGPIEVQQAGAGVPLLVVHGSGGGHDQGMAFAAPVASQGIRVIAMSRFGYLGTPMQADHSAAAQADAHACLLDALGIQQAGVMGISAGALSATQMAIRHADRVSALALIVPIAYKPSTQGTPTSPLSPWAGKLLMRLIGSDLLFWVGLQVARDQVIRFVLATPPEQVKAASPQERARVNAMANNILPVSARAQGLQADSQLANIKTRYPLELIHAPTLVISARDDGYGTFDGAQYTASQIKGARFVGYDTGGHLLVGHNEEVRSEIVKLFVAPVKH